VWVQLALSPASCPRPGFDLRTGTVACCRCTVESDERQLAPVTRLQAAPEPGAMVFPPFLPKQKGGRRKGETGSGSNVASGSAWPDLIATRPSSSVFRAHGLKSLCAFTARHFGFGQSNQSHCSGLGPCGVPSFRCRSTGPRRWAIHGPAALARRPASLPGSATPPLGLHQRRGGGGRAGVVRNGRKYRTCGK
jgi:hypothetical protein